VPRSSRSRSKASTSNTILKKQVTLAKNIKQIFHRRYTGISREYSLLFALANALGVSFTIVDGRSSGEIEVYVVEPDVVGEAKISDDNGEGLPMCSLARLSDAVFVEIWRGEIPKMDYVDDSDPGADSEFEQSPSAGFRGSIRKPKVVDDDGVGTKVAEQSLRSKFRNFVGFGSADEVGMTRFLTLKEAGFSADNLESLKDVSDDSRFLVFPASNTAVSLVEFGTPTIKVTNLDATRPLECQSVCRIRSAQSGSGGMCRIAPGTSQKFDYFGYWCIHVSFPGGETPLSEHVELKHEWKGGKGTNALAMKKLV
jgi:hypothetical protein